MSAAHEALREAFITGRPATLKWTCDREGNWRQVAVHIKRAGNGWKEVAVVPTATQQGRAA